MSFKGKAELGSRGLLPTPDYREWFRGRINKEAMGEFAPMNPLQSNDISKVESALKRKVSEHKLALDNLEIQRTKKVRAIREAEAEFVAAKRDSENVRRNSPLFIESQNLKAENQELKTKINEEREAGESRLNASLIVSRREIATRETRIQQLEARVAELEHYNHNLQLEMVASERAASNELNVALLKVETMTAQMNKLQAKCEARAQIMEELEKEVEQWKFEVVKVHDKIEHMARFINLSVPSFIEAFKKAEWQVHLPYIPSELEELLVFGRFLINRWEAMLKM